jgi:hypothetical protein
MIRPAPFLPALVLMVLYFLGLYRLIRLSPYLGLDWTDYWEPWEDGSRLPSLGKTLISGLQWETMVHAPEAQEKRV